MKIKNEKHKNIITNPNLELPGIKLSGFGGWNGSNLAPGGTAPGGKSVGSLGLDNPPARNGSKIMPPPPEILKKITCNIVWKSKVLG